MQRSGPEVWVGVDAGKVSHWAHAVDASGTELLSRRVENDEADLLKLISEVLSLAEDAAWAIDQPGGGAALLLALLWERNQRVVYMPGIAPWTELVMLTAASLKPTPAMPASSPIRPA